MLIRSKWAARVQAQLSGQHMAQSPSSRSNITMNPNIATAAAQVPRTFAKM